MADAVSCLTGHAHLQLRICRIWYFYTRNQFLLCASLQECWQWQVMCLSISCWLLQCSPVSQARIVMFGWYISKRHFSANFTGSEWECVPAGRRNQVKEVSVSSALALCPAVEGQCHDGGMYSQSQLVDWNQELTAMFFVFPSTHRRGPKTQHWLGLEGKEQCCSKWIWFIYLLLYFYLCFSLLSLQVETVLKLFCFAICSYCVGAAVRDRNMEGEKRSTNVFLIKIVVCIAWLVWRTDMGEHVHWFWEGFLLFLLVQYLYTDLLLACECISSVFMLIIYNLFLETSCLTSY